MKDQFIEEEITTVKFYSIFLNKIHLFYDANGRTFKVRFANDYKVN